MTKATPGPWTSGQCSGGGWSVFSDGLMTDIAIVDGREDQGSARLCRLQPGVDEANARLIALAPRMLASLKRLMSPNPGSDDREEAGAVIDEAEGK